jgi:hypothetical protein
MHRNILVLTVLGCLAAACSTAAPPSSRPVVLPPAPTASHPVIVPTPAPPPVQPASGQRLSGKVSMSTTATVSGLASSLPANGHDAVALSASRLAFPAGGSAACPPAAQSVHRAGRRLVIRMRPPRGPCTAPQRFTVVVTVNHPILRHSGLRMVDVNYTPRHQTHLTLAT